MGEVTRGRNLFEGRTAIGYDHGYDAQKVYLRLALDLKYIEGFVEGCLDRMGEDQPEDEELFRDLWEDESERETVLQICRRSAKSWSVDRSTTSLLAQGYESSLEIPHPNPGDSPCR